MCQQIYYGICTFFVGLLVLVPGGLILTWWNEANNVCTQEAFEDAETYLKKNQKKLTPTGGASAYDPGCDPSVGTFGMFVHIECAVDDTLKTTVPSLGVTAHGAYKVAIQSQQFTYERSETSQTKTVCHGTGNCKDKKDSCVCYELKWTTDAATSIDKFNLCDRCYTDRNIILPASIVETSAGSIFSSSSNSGGADPLTSLGYFDEFAEDGVSLGGGAFLITTSQIPYIAFQPSVALNPPLTSSNATYSAGFVGTYPGQCGPGAYDYGGCLYLSAGRTDMVGDRRILLKAYGSDALSAVGTESRGAPVQLVPEDFGGSLLPPCDTRPIFYVSDGYKSISQLFVELITALNTMTVLLRFVGFGIVVFGFYTAFSPIEEVVEHIPFLGQYLAPMVGFVLLCFSTTAGLALWLLVFALAWLVYRPLIGIPLLGFSIFFAWYAAKIQRENKQKYTEGKEGATPEDLIPIAEANPVQYGT